MMAYLMNKTQKKIIVKKVFKAKTFWSRVKGLIGKSSLNPEEALWIVPCKSIHTFFMQFNIDVIFADKKLKVQAVYKNMKPWRMTLWHFKAHCVFELKGGVLNHQVSLGDQLYVES